MCLFLYFEFFVFVGMGTNMMQSPMGMQPNMGMGQFGGSNMGQMGMGQMSGMSVQQQQAFQQKANTAFSGFGSFQK